MTRTGWYKNKDKCRNTLNISFVVGTTVKVRLTLQTVESGVSSQKEQVQTYETVQTIYKTQYTSWKLKEIKNRVSVYLIKETL